MIPLTLNLSPTGGERLHDFSHDASPSPLEGEGVGGEGSEKRLIIAVDGPAGAGKGSVCRAVAEQFDLAYLDTGAIYRALALLSLRSGVTDTCALAHVAAEMPFAFRRLVGSQYAAFLHEEEVTLLLRQEQVGERASLLAALPAIRTALLGFQRRYGGAQNAIFDGRDIGSVVWPEAQLKIFLTADLTVRAKRRALELQPGGEADNLHQIEIRMAERDARDANRIHAPLVAARDVVVVDTTYLTLEQSTARVMCEVARLLSATSGVNL